MHTTVTTDAVTGEVTVYEWTEEEIQARRERLEPVAWANLRSERNKRLEASDANVLPDRWASYTPEKQAEWATYRQTLRDLPENTPDPFEPVWPVKPS